MNAIPGRLDPLQDVFTPPRPDTLSAVLALLRGAVRGDGDLLSLLPTSAYRTEIGRLGYSRRSILIVNQPELVRQVLVDPDAIFPKSDLMVNALEPLIGDSIFVSSGSTWQRQRGMIDPALSMMRVNCAFPAMAAGATACEQELTKSSPPSPCSSAVSPRWRFAA
jgi:cytochrome P450